MPSKRHQPLPSAHAARNQRAAVLPIVVSFLTLAVAMLAISADVMRIELTGNLLDDATRAAALYAYSQGCTPEGNFDRTIACDRMVASLSTSGGDRPWNTAPSATSWNAGVGFRASDMTFPSNPCDSDELLLQLTASRKEDETLDIAVLSALQNQLARLSKTRAPGRRFSIARTIQVFGQPANRIGRGANADNASGENSFERCFSVFPVAIKYEQFAQAARPETTQVRYRFLLPQASGIAQNDPSSIPACFVNLTRRTDRDDGYYEPASDKDAINNLIATVRYFQPDYQDAVMAPAAVERGCKLPCFNQTVQPNLPADLLGTLRNLPCGRFYILPVVSSFENGNCTVLGFARFKLVQACDPQTLAPALVFDIGDSVAVRNATAATALATIPSLNGMPVPAPPSGGPFVSRYLAPSGQGFTRRPRGVVLAPAVAPACNNT